MTHLIFCNNFLLLRPEHLVSINAVMGIRSRWGPDTHVSINAVIGIRDRRGPGTSKAIQRAESTTQTTSIAGKV